jgi:acetylornithine/succinyldiaminopimelate/putrescine aminotransferase
VILEPVQGESGVHVLGDDDLRAAREACDRHGAALIFDEVQCGLSRTGRLWAWEHSSVRPAALAVLDILGDPALQAGVLELGERLAEGLRELPGVVEVRGRGLMLAAELAPDHPEGAPATVHRALLNHRMVINATGPTTVRFLPPLTIGQAEADDALGRMGAALAG